VTNASTEDLETWNGFGRASLRNGLIWDIPIFGIISPVLNSVSPGLGSSQATEASGKYVITNGVIYTDSLLIRSTMSRLEYISSAGLRVLLVMAKKVQQAKGKVALFGLSPNVREVFSVSGFDTIFSIQPDSAAALAAVR